MPSAAPAIAQPKTELNRCVPADLREDAISFKTEDGVELPGLVFGSGSSGVLLAPHPDRGPLRLPGAVYEMRSILLRDKRHRYDLDVPAAAAELTDRGASSIVAGGAGTGATAIATVAQKVPGLKAMFLLTPFKGFHTSSSDLDSLTGIEDTRLADHARQIADAASNAKLEIVPGRASFVKLIEDAALREKVRAFVRETAPPPTFLERWRRAAARDGDRRRGRVPQACRAEHDHRRRRQRR